MTQTIRGLRAPAPRLTPFGAALFALAVALPGGGIVWLVSVLAG